MHSFICLLENASAISSLETHGNINNVEIRSVEHISSFWNFSGKHCGHIIIRQIGHKFQSNSVHLPEKACES